jgi:hypothetical protein
VTFFVLTVALPVGQLILSSFFQFFGFYQLDMLTLEHYRTSGRAASSGAPSATPCCSASSARP